MTAVAERLRRSGKLDEALAQLEKARQVIDLAAVELEIGRTKLLKKDLNGAQRAFEKALKTEPQSPVGQFGLAQVLAAKQKDPDAIEILERLIANAEEAGTPPPAAAMRLSATLRSRRGDYRGALDLLELLVKSNPNDAQALLDKGETEHRMQHPEDALKSYRRAIEVSNGAVIPASPSSAGPKTAGQQGKGADGLSGIDLYYLGRLTVEKNEDKAVALLTQSLKFDDTPLEARFYLGRTLFRHPKTKKQAKKELETFRRAAPEGDLAAQADRMIKAK